MSISSLPDRQYIETSGPMVLDKLPAKTGEAQGGLKDE